MTIQPLRTNTSRPVSAGRDEAQTPSKPKDWTVLAFMNGSNDLEPAVVKNLLDMEKVGSSDSVNIVAQLSRAPQKVAHPGAPHDRLDGDWDGTRRYYLTPAPHPDRAHRNITSPVVQELPPDTDMGSVKSLSSFLKWGIKNYPANHYLVVLNDHGAGFRGVSFDDVHESSFTMTDLKKGFEDVRKATGVKPDVLLFDACEMGQAEVAYQLKDAAHYMIGSEEVIGTAGLPYDKLMGELTIKPAMNGRQLSSRIVQVAGEDEADRLDSDDPDDDTTRVFSAVDETRMEPLRESIDALATSLEAAVPREVVAHLAQQTKRFSMGGHQAPEKDFRDLGDFAEKLLHSSIDNAKVRKAAENVQQELRHTVVAQEKEGEGMERTTGLSIYLPTRPGPDHPSRTHQKTRAEKDSPDPTWGYDKLDMSKDGEWNKFLTWLAPSAA